MTRNLIQFTGHIEPIETAPLIEGSLRDWLFMYLSEGDVLLAHAIDGVIWGKVTDGELITSHQMDADISPELRIETLQQLRLFNGAQELFLCRTAENNWKAHIATEQATDDVFNVMTEDHIMWGTLGTEKYEGDFTLLEDGSQGLKHIVPIDASGVNERNSRPCMRLLHHLEKDPYTNVTFIKYTRIAGVEVVKYA